MIELRDNRLVFRFREVHEDAVFTVDFQRTLRIPGRQQGVSAPSWSGQLSPGAR